MLIDFSQIQERLDGEYRPVSFAYDNDVTIDFPLVCFEAVLVMGAALGLAAYRSRPRRF